MRLSGHLFYGAPTPIFCLMSRLLNLLGNIALAIAGFVFLFGLYVGVAESGGFVMAFAGLLGTVGAGLLLGLAEIMADVSAIRDELVDQRKHTEPPA